MLDRLKQIGRAVIGLVKKPVVDKSRPTESLDIRSVRTKRQQSPTNSHVRRARHAWLEGKDGGK